MPRRPWLVTGLAVVAWGFLLLAAYGASELLLHVRELL